MVRHKSPAHSAGRAGRTAKETDPPSTTDWHAIAAELIERLERPLGLIDIRGRLCLANRPLRQLLGLRRVVSRDQWNAAFNLPRPTPAVERGIRSARRGGTVTCDLLVSRNDGRKMVLLLSLSRGGADTVLATVLAAIPTPVADVPQLPDGIRYEISTSSGRFGALRSLSAADGARLGKITVDARCHQVLFGREAPCSGCPALSLESSGAAIRQTGVVPTASGPFRLISAEKSDSSTVRLESVAVSDATLSALVQAKIDRLLRSAALSRRERDVLQLLLFGRTLREIATALGIGVRTVRFHQVNLLEKLGADSRADLIRLLL